MESSDTINEGKNDLQVLVEKQDTQFRALREALKDSLNNLGFALDNSVSKLSKSIDEKIDKLNSKHNSGQPEDLNRERLENDTSSSDPNGKRRVGPAKLPGNLNKKRIISQDDDSLKWDSHLPKKICFICFNGSPPKMMKNAFYFILKARFVLKIFKFLS